MINLNRERKWSVYSLLQLNGLFLPTCNTDFVDFDIVVMGVFQEVIHTVNDTFAYLHSGVTQEERR